MPTNFKYICLRGLISKESDVPKSANKWRPRQNSHHSPEDIFKYIFLNENVYIFITILLKFVLKGPINNIPVLIFDNGLALFRPQAIIWTNGG